VRKKLGNLKSINPSKTAAREGTWGGDTKPAANCRHKGGMVGKGEGGLGQGRMREKMGEDGGGR